MMSEPDLVLDTMKELLNGSTLSRTDTVSLFEAMMSGEVDQPRMASCLSLMASRDPALDELVGAAEVMRRHVTAVPTNIPEDQILDTAGTGGAPKTFNVSTAAAIVASSCGIPVAKHGNRSRSGRGSAEVLSGIGVDIDADLDTQSQCLNKAGICFCFAIHHHPATRHVAPVRKSLGFPTIFNLLGPLTNPVAARRQLIGVWDQQYGALMAQALADLGTIHGLVAHSEDGLDEISISAPTTLWWVENGEVREDRVSPEEVGLRSSSIEDVTARDLEHAIELVRGVLDGSIQGAPLDMVLINAAAAIRVGGMAHTWDEGIEAAKRSIERGEAKSKLLELASISSG